MNKEIIYNRKIYLFITIISFVIGLVILHFKYGFIRGFLSDVIINIFIYSFIKMFFNVKPIKLASFVLAFSFFTEFMQYIKILNYINLQNNLIIKIILGATFDLYDLLAYLVGVIIIYIIDIKFVLNKI